ncbi:MAG: ABC transporter permease [Bacilli bacterium]|nr:ABC transporter permease [Bacilli bacterium]
MINLLKADFFRVLRTKIVYISLIIAVILPLFIAVVNGLTAMATASLYSEGYEPSPAGDTLLGNTFSPVMSFSYIFAVFPVIVIMMDFGNGTLRNKIIHGYTRQQIYAAHFIVSLIHITAITLIFVTTNVVSALVLGISEVPADLISAYLVYYLVGFLGVVMVASLGCCMALSLGNAGAIVITILGTLVLTYLGSIIGLILRLNDVTDMEHFLCFFPSYLTETLSSYLLYPTPSDIPHIEPMYIVEAVSGVLLLSGGFYGLGSFIFSKRDFK